MKFLKKFSLTTNEKGLTSIGKLELVFVTKEGVAKSIFTSHYKVMKFIHSFFTVHDYHNFCNA